MLACQYPADLHTQPQDVGAERFSALQLTFLVRIVHDEWMEVAIAGVEYIGNTQSVLVRHLAHAGEHARQRSAWNRAIHAVVIRRDAANRGKCCLPARPEQLP